ncbi:MAG: hypothetical protein ACPGR5_05330, partial [Chitinophagales bacterium]
VLKFMGIFFLIFIGIGAVFFILTTIISGIFSLLGMFGVVLQMIFQYIVQGFVVGLSLSFIICLYYDYAKPQIVDKLELEDNLIL